MASSKNVAGTLSVSQLPLAYVETTRDGIACVAVADLLAIVSSLRGQPTDGLHLRRGGREIPLAVIDSNGVLDDADTLLFVGSRPAGDTTFFDAYSTVAAFELWYDGQHPPLRYQRDTLVAGVPRQHLLIERHIEEEHEYVQGWLDTGAHREYYSTFVTETVEGEQWAWMVTSSLRPFQTLLWLAPDPARGDSVTVELRYAAINDDITIDPDQVHRLFYAGVQRDSATFDGPRYNVLRCTLDPLRDGTIVDSLVFRSYVPGVAAQAIDFITTRGIERAVAYADLLVGSCTSEQAEVLGALNFRSQQVVTLDTSAHRWGVWEGERGTVIRIGARSGTTPRSSIAIGDTAVVRAGRSITLAWLDSAGTLQFYSDSRTAPVAGLLALLPLGTPYAIAVPDVQLVGTDLREQLQQEGSQLIATLSSGAYVAASVRGVPSLFHEHAATSAALIAWLPSSAGRAFAVTVPLSTGEHYVVAQGYGSIERARIRLCGGAQLLADTNRADYLVITHSRFEPAAQRLATFRQQHNGVRARVVDVQDIFDAFGGGQKSPHAIKRFLQYAYQHWQQPPPSAVVLVGDASWDPRKVSAGAINEDFVPSYGKPVSDYWYTLLEGDDMVPEMAIGRLPCSTLDQAHAIVDKIIEHDTLPWERWQKRFLFITGGANADEQFDFYSSVTYSLVPLLVEPMQRALCGDTVIASLYLDGASSNPPLPVKIVSSINGGVGWVNYIGHGAPQTLEVGGWEPQHLANGGRYPILASFSCQIGAFAEPSGVSLGEEFLTQARRGMVAVIATTGFGIRSYDDQINTGIFFYLARDRVRTLGDLLTKAKLFITDSRSQLAINTLMQTSLLGDPLTRVLIDTLPRPVIDASTLRIESIPPALMLTSGSDSMRVTALLFNAGTFVDSAFRVALIRHYGASSDTASTLVTELCHSQQLQFTLPVRDMPGEHQLEFVIDPEGRLGRMLPGTSATAYVYGAQLYPVEPQPGWNISPRDTVVRFLNPLGAETPYRYEAYLLSSEGDTLISHRTAPVREQPLWVEWSFPAVLEVGRAYRILLRGYNTRGDHWTPWLEIPVCVTASVPPDRIEHWQGSSFGWQQSTIDGFTVALGDTLLLQQYADVELLSAGSYQESGGDTIRQVVAPAYRLRLFGQNVASERSDEIGVHVAVLSTRDAALKAVRWYTTWTSQPVPRSFGNTEALINFLRDTVSAEDYVLLVSCGSAWAGDFARFATGFAQVLQQFGAEHAAELRGSRSYVFVGSKASARPFVFERINPEGIRQGADTIAVQLRVPLYPLQGVVELPVAGPAAAWDSLVVDAECPQCVQQVEIYGGSSHDAVQTLLVSSDAVALSLQRIDAAVYPYLKAVCTLTRLSDDYSPCRVVSANISYTPRAEVAVNVDVDARTPLRGDTVTATVTLANLVQRTSGSTVTLRTALVSQGGVPIAADGVGDTTLVLSGVFQQQLHVPTLLLPDTCSVQARVEVQPGGDLYSFNNIVSRSLAVRNDTEPPHIVAYAGQLLLSDTTVVPRTVVLDCALLDSARVPLQDSTVLELRLNGLLLPQPNQLYRFYSTAAVRSVERWASEPLVRAAVQAQLQLESGINVLIVRARDYFGNVTTRRYVLLVPRELRLDSVAVFPNPLTDAALATFVIGYTGFEPAVSATLELYDALGRRVLQQPLQLQAGSNTFRVSLAEQDGEALQSGVYYWRVWIDEVGSAEARSGVLVLLR